MQLVAENLTIERGGRIVVERLSLSAQAGEAVVLRGPNGAGKTTLLRALAGYLPTTEGSIRLDGGDAEKSIAEQSHVVGHANGVKANLTVRENITFWASFLDGEASRRDRIDVAMDHFGLLALEDYPASYLSAGQRRRVGLARLVAAERPIWLLDEPTVSLDTASITLLATAIDRHTAEGGIVLAATHVEMGLQRVRSVDLGSTGSASNRASDAPL